MQIEIDHITDAEIRQRLVIGEDQHWEFKQIKFKGDRPNSPEREDLADEIIAFANANGGVLLCGVSDDGQLQGMSPKQLTALNHVLSEEPLAKIIFRLQFSFYFGA
ncbi:MAG: ATP-binding protein, partial [Bacteroidota bacterium]|nr:ATP-binding protein [Bacteroidota bacterium]MXW15807.1 ATP-binding protein [Rhodothermaceae bacterium]MDE2644598.1 ATP-binding protein [Bacteroidota bacterium]MXZ18186.1 ATP-binding protein [Rhodothermaceae bacterium]MXZ57909.1 ATP-binding protein [Rhodothermaceae bacterium]